jgi:glycine oxidase
MNATLGPRPDVIVVGGGVIGCTIAWELASRHHAKVVVLERAVPGAEASSAAAGILGAQVESHDRPSDGGMLFSLLLASRAGHALLDARLRESVGLSTGYVKCGVLRVTHDPSRVASLARAHTWQCDMGGNVEVIDRVEALRLEPALGDVAGGVLLADEAQVDPPALLRALQQACAQSGVVFQGGTIVRGVITQGGLGVETNDAVLRAGSIVIAAGSWSSLVSGLPAGIRSVRPVRGQIVQVETRPPIVRRIVVGDEGYVVARPDGRTLLGSTMEEVGHVKEVTAGGVYDVLGRALALLPGLARAPISGTWSGFRPATPDDRPILGPTSTPRLFLATGHHRNGILLAPETGRLIADLVVTGRCDRDLSAFAPEKT